jgi:hypothetical protein
MAELKTRPSEKDAHAFIAAVEPPSRRADCQEVARIMERATGAPPTMWGTAIVGFGRYTYVNTTNKPVDWMLTGFSPRKANLTLYIMSGFADYNALMAKLGKHTTGKSCLYIKTLADIDLEVLEKLVSESVLFMRSKYGAA